ncbi:sigma-54-dependent transcriptional regulator [Chloroflexota bacterium]
MVGELGRVLVVDDDKSIRNVVQRILEEVGYDVVTAANGQEALDKVSQLMPEAVVLDIKMPGMSGMEVLTQIAANRHDICVVMATAVYDAQTAVDAMKLGAYDYITKPFSRADLVLKVRRALEKRHLMLENECHRLDLEKRAREQTKQLQQQFVELVETLAREHKILYKLAGHQRGGAKSLLKRLPPELQEPMSSVEEFSEAMLRILKNGIEAKL